MASLSYELSCHSLFSDHDLFLITFKIKPFAQSGTGVVWCFMLGPANFPRQKLLLQQKEYKTVNLVLFLSV